MVSTVGTSMGGMGGSWIFSIGEAVHAQRVGARDGGIVKGAVADALHVGAGPAGIYGVLVFVWK